MSSRCTSKIVRKSGCDIGTSLSWRSGKTVSISRVKESLHSLLLHPALAELHWFELSGRVNPGLGAHRRKKFLAETNRTFRAGVNEVGALDGFARAAVGSSKWCEQEAGGE